MRLTMFLQVILSDVLTGNRDAHNFTRVRRPEALKSAHRFETFFSYSINPPNNKCMGPWRAQTSELNHCLRLGQLPFCHLGFMHMNISHISSVDPAVNSEHGRESVSLSVSVAAERRRPWFIHICCSHKCHPELKWAWNSWLTREHFLGNIYNRNDAFCIIKQRTKPSWLIKHLKTYNRTFQLQEHDCVIFLSHSVHLKCPFNNTSEAIDIKSTRK